MKGFEYAVGEVVWLPHLCIHATVQAHKIVDNEPCYDLKYFVDSDLFEVEALEEPAIQPRRNRETQP